MKMWINLTFGYARCLPCHNYPASNWGQPSDPDVRMSWFTIAVDNSELPLPAAQLAFTLSLPGPSFLLRLRVHPEPIAGWLFPRGARRVCDRSPYKQREIRARRSQNPPESAAAAASGPTTSGHRQICAIFLIVSNIFGLNVVCLVSVSGVDWGWVGKEKLKQNASL